MPCRPLGVPQAPLFSPEVDAEAKSYLQRLHTRTISWEEVFAHVQVRATHWVGQQGVARRYVFVPGTCVASGAPGTPARKQNRRSRT